MVTEEAIQQQITKISKERDAFLAQANQQIAAFNGALQALQQLLEPEPAPAAAEGEQAAT